MPHDQKIIIKHYSIIIKEFISRSEECIWNGMHWHCMIVRFSVNNCIIDLLFKINPF